MSFLDRQKHLLTLDSDTKDQRKDSTRVHFADSVSWLGLIAEAWVIIKVNKSLGSLWSFVLPKTILQLIGLPFI